MEISDLRKAIADVKIDEIEKLVKELINEGADPVQVLEEGITKGLYDLGDKFEKRKVFIPDLIKVSKTVTKCIDGIIKEALPKEKAKIPKKIVIGTMTSQHNIGKNLVSLFLTINGFEVHDIGEGCSPWDFYENAQKIGADMIAVSCVFMPALTKFAELIDILKQLKVRDKYKILVGGAVTTKQWAEEVGADGWAKDAADAVKVAKELLGLK